MSNSHRFENFTCTVDTCPIRESHYDYRPSLPMNSALLAIFAISLLLNIAQGIWYRTWTFAVALVLGNIAEVIGYVGRVKSYIDPWDMNAFLIQICCLTIAPAFIAAGIYLSLARIVIIFGADISRIPPQRYTQFFIFCDFVSLVLQGTGGGIASVRSQNNESPALGTHIMVAGLASQVFTLSIFILLAGEYAHRVITSGRQLDPMYAHLRGSKKFLGFLAALSFATLCIMIRSIYRLIELSQGWGGALISNERYFFVLEGVMVIFAVAALNAFHPGMCLQDAYNASSRNQEKDTAGSETEANGSTMFTGA
ncbi:RTA1-domain-containing protein [Wilcoxina mikolae CBS 423.85]|nr:RTA1-domain-containing protein [Wilcoxina mikolae CBS 423.85]